MRYLLDTHILMWLLYEPHKVSPRMKNLLQAAHAELHVSIVSLWEIIIKAALGKYPLSPHFFEELLKTDVHMLAVSLEHLALLLNMPHHHSDPFDRLLIAQAQYEKLRLLRK